MRKNRYLEKFSQNGTGNFMDAHQTSSSTDNWSSILSDLGIGDAAPAAAESPAKRFEEERIVSQTVPKTEKAAPVETTPEPIAEKMESEVSPAEVAKPNEPKKRFFDRFPKIDLFGPGKEKKGKSLESIVEGVRSPSLSGKSFTSHTIEKVPVSPERASKHKEEQEKHREEPERQEFTAAKTKDKRFTRENREEIEPVTTPLSIDVDDPWSQVAAQVGILSAEESKSSVKTLVEKKAFAPRQKRQGKQEKKMEPETAFAPPAAGSDEAAALSVLMEGWDSDSRFDKEAEKRLNSILEDEQKEEPPFGFERTEAAEVPTVKKTFIDEVPPASVRGRRGERFQKNPPEDFRGKPDTRRYPSREQEEERPSFGGRGARTKADESLGRQEERTAVGRRGSRYQEKERVVSDEPAEERFYQERRPSRAVEPTERLERTERGNRRERYSEEPRREPMMRKESDAETLAFKGIPTWDEAIMVLIDKNSAQHSASPSYRRR